MSLNRLSDLLPLHDGVKPTSAHEVFGLSANEQNAEIVRGKIQQTIRRLNELKNQADPKIWKQAAKLVKQAQVSLNDPLAAWLPKKDPLTFTPPSRKQPDRSGNAHTTGDLVSPATVKGVTTQTGPAAPPVPPPLATPAPSTASATRVSTANGRATVPAESVADPTETASIPEPDLAESDVIVGTRLPSLPDESTEVPPPSDSSLPIAIDAHAESRVVEHASPFSISISDDAKPHARHRTRSAPRRRTKSSTTAWLSGIVVTLLTAIGCLAFFFFRPDPVEPRDGTAPPKDGSFTVKVVPPSASEAPPRQRNSKSLASSLESDLTSNGLQPAMSRDLATSPDKVDASLNPNPKAESARPSLPTPMNAKSGDTRLGNGVPSDPPRPGDSVDDPASGDSPDAIAKADEAIEVARIQVRTGNMTGMLAATDRAVAIAVTESQNDTAGALHQFAELVQYYTGAVDRTLGLLQAGEVLQLTSTLQVSIVDVTPDHVVLKFNGKNRTYDRNALPIVLVDRMAADSLADMGSTALAAKACYHAVAPQAATDADRRQALGWLRSIREEIVGADRDDLIMVMESWSTP